MCFTRCLGAEVTGIELSKTGTELARKTAEANGVADRCTFITRDFSKYELPKEKFDVLTMHAVLHHAIKYPKVKEKVFEATKPGGRIVITDTVRGSKVLESIRKAVKFIWRLKPSVKRHEEDLGDVLFGVEVYEQFAEGASEYEIEMMDFFYMVNRVFERLNTKSLPARLVRRLANAMDNMLANIFPAIRKRYGNAVMRIIK